MRWRRACSRDQTLISNLDIYRSAKLLVDQHGEDAATEAAMRADNMLAAGDMNGKQVWVRIMKAVEELQRQVPGPGEREH